MLYNYSTLEKDWFRVIIKSKLSRTFIPKMSEY